MAVKRRPTGRHHGDLRNALEPDALVLVMVAAGTDLFDTLMSVARRIAAEPAAAFDLLVRVAAAAHGSALFLRQNMLPAGQDDLAEAEERAAHTAHAVVDQVARAEG